MTEERKAEIRRRARQDAQALRAGWPVQCPYLALNDADEWKKQFDMAIAEGKK